MTSSMLRGLCGLFAPVVLEFLAVQSFLSTTVIHRGLGFA